MSSKPFPNSAEHACDIHMMHLSVAVRPHIQAEMQDCAFSRYVLILNSISVKLHRLLTVSVFGLYMP